MTGSAFPTMRTLWQGYLHEDVIAEHGGADAAVRAFCADATPAELRSLMGEWRMFSVRTADWTIGEIAQWLTDDLGGAWQPQSKRELLALFDVLKAHES